MEGASSKAELHRRKEVDQVSMTSRRINVLIAVQGLHFGGAEVVIQHLVRALDRDRFKVTVACLKSTGAIGEQLIRDGIDVVTLAERGSPRVDYLSFLKLHRLIQGRNIQVLHTHTTDALVDAALCRLLNPRLRIVHTFHFGNYPHVSRKKWFLEIVFSRFANRIVAVGEVQRQQIIQTYRLAESSISRVWNGVPSNTVTPGGSFRERIGGTGRIVVGTIATLTTQKGLTDLLAVASRQRECGSNVLFVVVGDGPLRAELEATRAKLRLEDAVVFTGWVKDASRVAMPEFDVFFQPSLWEAMSIAILEAMAAGRAILATRVGENPRIIDHGVDGLLVEPQDLDGMTSALTRLVCDTDLRRRLGNAAARKVSSEFTIEKMTRSYERMYLEVS